MPRPPSLRQSARKPKKAATKDKGHGRKETRTAIVASVKDMAEKHGFPGLTAVARITSKRGRDKTVQRYFLLTRRYTPAELLHIVRQHWGIENVLHWTLDVVLDEDQTRSRKDHARQPRRSAPTCTQHCPCSSRHKDFVARQAQTCRLGRQFPRRYAPQHAIALVLWGRGRWALLRNLGPLIEFTLEHNGVSQCWRLLQR
jgi:predicted transposase YbfD/YdcC